MKYDIIQEMWPSIVNFVNQEFERESPFTISSAKFSDKFSLSTDFFNDLDKIAEEKKANFKIKPTAISNEYPEDAKYENYFDIKFTKIS